MKPVLLDTSFIITSVKQKVDFFEALVGYEILIPKQVIKELEGLEEKLVLKILSKNKFKEIDLKTKNVDEGIIKYCRENKEIILATLDLRIKKKARNKKLVIRGKKKVKII